MKRTKRMLALLVGAALATMAFGAASASAATVVKDAKTGQLCSAVKPAINTSAEPFSLLTSKTLNYESGGCTVHLTGGGYVTGFAFQADNSCSSEFDVHIGPDGWGYIDNVKYYECTYIQTKPCAGDRLVAPVEYNPTLFGGKAFKYANAETDLNVSLCSNLTGDHWGFASFDVTNIVGGHGWKIQQSEPQEPWYHHTGLWTSPSAVTITH